MKIGIHLSTYTKTWSEDLFPYLEISKNIGYQGVEIPLMDPFSFPIDKFHKELKRLNLEVTCGTGLSKETDITSDDDIIKNRGIDHLKKCVDICEQLGSKVLGGVLYSPWGYLTSKEKGKNGINRSILCLREIGLYAEKKGVVLNLEILNRYESYFVNTVAEGKELLKKISCKNIKLHFDTFHSHIEENNLLEAIKEGGNDIGHIHFCENTRGVPGTGQINWHGVVKTLKGINYDKWIVVENFVMPSCEVGETLNIWRKIDENGEKAATDAYNFITKLLKEN